MDIKEIRKKIDDNALFALCVLFDGENGEYPEHHLEGAAVYRFFKEEKAK